MSRLGLYIATAYSTDDRDAVIKLVEYIVALGEFLKAEGQLRLSVALVTAKQIDRMMAFHRLFDKKARVLDWNDLCRHPPLCGRGQLVDAQ